MLRKPAVISVRILILQRHFVFFGRGKLPLEANYRKAEVVVSSGVSRPIEESLRLETEIKTNQTIVQKVLGSRRNVRTRPVQLTLF